MALICAVILGTASARAAEVAPDEVVPYKSVGERTLSLNIFVPQGHEASAKRPAIVFFHGGGWSKGKPSQFYPQCRHLAGKGMVAISAEYRLTSEEGVKPWDCVSDAKSAIRWVRQNAEKLGIDPERIAAGGGSAGGHLASATANLTAFEPEGEETDISSKPNALILFNPVANNGPGGFGHSGVKDQWQEFSPMHNIDADSPPTLLLNGTQDHLVPVDDIREYERRMKEAGVHCDVRIYEGEGHGFFNHGKPAYGPTVAEMDSFLEALGYL